MALAAAALPLAIARADEPEKSAAPKRDVTKPDAQFKSLSEKASYIIGLDIGSKIKTGAPDLSPEVVAKGIRDAFAGKTAFTDAEKQQILQAYQEELNAKKAKESQDFLTANKKKAGVVTLPSGLQYKVLKEGSGKSPKATDVVTTNYEGKLVDGTVFDSSYKRGEPTSFPVNRVIKGWTEALQLMKVGSKWQRVIPPNLAYGKQPPPGSPIPPDAVLVFDIELLDTKQGQQQ